VSRTFRILAVVLLLAVAVVPVAQYASAATHAGHHASMRHAPRTPGSTVVAGTVLDAVTIPRLPRVGIVASPAAEDRPIRALAAPFVPPRD
jgi:hypothetical protein